MSDQLLSTNTVVSQELQKIGQQSHQPLYSKMTKEEHDAVIAKMIDFTQLPPGHLPKQDELYLEQQLTDMLGFEVAAELDGHRLNHSLGIMAGQPHLRRHQMDTLAEHDVYREAGLGQKRSVFGWFMQMGKLTPEVIQREKYYISVQANFLPNWHIDYRTLASWYKFRKMIVINPAEAKAVVVVVGNTGPADWMQKQFGGSPEIIREAAVWSMKSRGRVLVFFINDLQDTIPLGVIDLQRKD